MEIIWIVLQAFISPNIISNLLQGLEMHTKPWVRARASKEYWQNMKPAGKEQFSFQTVPFAYQKPFFKKCLFLFGQRLGGGRGVNSCLDRLGFFFPPCSDEHFLLFLVCESSERAFLCVDSFVWKLVFCVFIYVSQCQVVGPSVLRWQNRTTGASQQATRCSSRKYDLFLKYTFIEVRFITPLWVP